MLTHQIVKVISVTSLLLVGVFANAGKMVVVDMGDQQMKSNLGQDEIPIKQLLRQQGLKPKDLDILSVLMVAKSRVGQGSVYMTVGNASTFLQTIDGEKSEFKSESERSFDRILLENPKADSKGAVKLNLKGNIIVRQLVIEVDEQKPDEAILELNDLRVENRDGFTPIALKQELKKLTDLDAKDYDLSGITVFIKGQIDSGIALQVGPNTSAGKRVEGRPGKFHRPGAHTYEQIELKAIDTSAEGVWRLWIKGDVKIDKIILHLQDKK